MKRLLLQLAILVLAATIGSNAWSQAAFVQSGNSSQTTIDTTVTLTGVANGNYLVAFAVREANSSNSVISTTAGSTGAWTNSISQIEAGDFATIDASYAVATATGNVTIQATRNTGAWVALFVVEFSGIASFDSAQYARDTTNPRETAATAPGSYNAMAIGFGLDWSASTPGVTAGWTTIGTGMNYGATPIGAASYRSYSSGNAQASFTGAGADPVFVVNFIFIETTGGGGSGPAIPIVHHHRQQQEQ